MFKIDRKIHRVSHVADAKLASKAVDAAAPNDPGELTGYLAVFGNIDLSGEIIVKGAFTRTISQKLSNGKTLPLMRRHFAHGGGTLENIGSIVEAKEDDYGLWIRAIYSSDPDSQAVRTKVREQHVKSLSVGYFPVKWGCRPAVGDDELAATGKAGRDDVLELFECELSEGTVTCNPVNEMAAILTAKSIQTECPHCKQKIDVPQGTAPAKTIAPDSTAQASAVTPLASKSALALTASHRGAARKRELELLGVL